MRNPWPESSSNRVAIWSWTVAIGTSAPAGRLRRRADGEHVRQRSLGDHQVAVVVRHQDAQALANEVVRHLVELPAPVEVERSMRSDRLVDRVDEARLEERVEVRVAQHLLALVPVQVQGRADAHHSLGQRAGLVAAEDVHAAEVLDRREAPDDHLAERHALRAVRQVDADDGGKQLRREADRDGQREDEGLENRAVEGDVDREDGDHQDQRDLHQEVPEPTNAALEFGFRGAEPQPFGHFAELRPRRRADDNGHGAAAHDVRAHEERVRPLAERRVGRDGLRRLCDGVGFACQRRLVEKEVLRFEHQAVARDALARRQEHDVARDDSRDGDFLVRAVPQCRGLRLHDRQQRVDRVCRAALLPEPKQAARQNDGQDDQRVGGVVQEERQAGRERQDEDQRALELAEQEHQLPGSSPRLKDVGAVTFEPPSGVRVRQALLGRLQPLEHVGGGNAPEALEGVVHAAKPPDETASHPTVSPTRLCGCVGLHIEPARLLAWPFRSVLRIA